MTQISYYDLAKKVGDMVLCNDVNKTDEYWYEHIIQGINEDDGDMPEIYQSYIITERGATELYNHTDEIIGYNPTLNVFVWHITHFGTPWNGVHTDYDEDAEHVWDLSEQIKHIN